MLPGFRFLFSAIILSTSILIFGLGAAALLRAAHEEFASNPTWRAPPETVFAQPGEAAKPVLATLVVEPTAAEQKKPEAPAAIASLPAEPEHLAAAKAEDASPIEAAKSEPPAETPPAGEPAPVQANATEPPAIETKIAAIEAAPPPASEPEQASAPAAPEVDKSTAKIATLGSPPAGVEAPTAKAANTEPDKSAIKRRLRAKRARERRRLAQYRAMLARQQATLQPATDLFGQPTYPLPLTTNAPPRVR